MQILFLCLSIFIVLCSLVYHILIGLPRWLSGKESACQCRRLEFDPGLRISLGKGNGNPLQYSCLENPMDRGAWRATVHGVTRVGHDWVTKQQNLKILL